MKPTQRKFIPGSKWLYIKLYTGSKTADRILTKEISAIIIKLQKQNKIEKWFFIRYADPDFHIRVRFLMNDDSYIGEAIFLFYKQLNPLIKNNIIWKVQFDTYNRELERYGNMLIEAAESIFHIDSDCIVSIIKKINQFQKEDYRWMIALRLIDAILSDFELILLEKQNLMLQLSQSYKIEFGFTEYNTKQFNTKYRGCRQIIEDVLEYNFQELEFLSLNVFIEQRTNKMKVVVKHIYDVIKNNQVDINIQNLIVSYVHMMMNRLFRSKNRIHELILYDFMRRYYTSKIAQNKLKAD